MSPKHGIVNLHKVHDKKKWCSDPNNLYIGRGEAHHNLPASKWQNPFHVQDFGPVESVRRFEKDFRNSPSLIADIGEIKGKRLGCWCDDPSKCHGSVLLKALQETEQTNSGGNRGEANTQSYKGSGERPHMVASRDAAGGGCSTRSGNVERNGDNERTPIIVTEKYPTPYKTAVQEHNVSRKVQKIVMLMDSNRRHIDFHTLCPETEIVMMRCGVAPDVANAIEQNLGSPTNVIIHVGTNDVEHAEPALVAERITGVARRASERFGAAAVSVSLIPPRSDKLNEAVTEVNERLRTTDWQGIKLIEHKDIETRHLHDSKHLSRSRLEGERLTGTQYLARDFYHAIYGKFPSQGILRKSRRW